MKSPDASTGLPEAWILPPTTARLHILRAHGASKAVIIRRKPSRLVHIISWDTSTDIIEHGSWFDGRIYAERCDLSWDGRWMVYLAMGRRGETWNGLCRPPSLESVLTVPNCGTWAGGGFFSDANTLQSNDHWHYDRSLSIRKFHILSISHRINEIGRRGFPHPFASA